MIDTVKFRIPIDENDYRILLENSNVHVGYNYKTKDSQYVIIKTPIAVGSDSRERIIRVPRQFVKGAVNYAELELSIQKFLMAHNVYMIHVSSLETACRDLAKNLAEQLNLKTDISAWEIQRIDLCYNWKLETKEQLNSYLNIFQNLDYARKKKYTYDTSAMYKGTAYTVKIYSKYEEYLAHDIKYLKKYSEDHAYTVLEDAERVLRFEVTIKKPHFLTVFHKSIIRITDITEDIVYLILNTYFSKLTKLTNTSICESDSNYTRLVDAFGDVKGRDLFQKLCMWIDEDPVYRDVFKSYSYSNRYKFFKDLKKANVSLQGKESKTLVMLSIPSEYALYSEIY